MQGIFHPLQTPAHIILIIGLAFFIGQQSHLKILLLALFAIIAGFALNHFNLLNWNTELILLSLALICGLLLVLRLNLPTVISLVLLIISSVILGLDSSPIMIPGLSTNSIYSWRLGAGITLTVGVVLLSLLAYLLNRFWNGIILRVAGSWIATSAIFVLTLMLAGQ
jgi:hypothetical protein